MFVFEHYDYDKGTGKASFHYRLDDERQFVESVELEPSNHYNQDVFDRALFLSFLLVGISYYKTFPTQHARFASGAINADQANFLNHVYQEGLGQFAAENSLTRDDLLHFEATLPDGTSSVAYDGSGILSLQSGGKDSLLTASILAENDIPFTSFYVSSADTHPSVMDSVGDRLVTVKRLIDRPGLVKAAEDGGRNGHIPVTYVVMSYALLQAILLNKKTVLTSIGHEGEEPREWIGDLPVNHQWSKTWEAEQLFAAYVGNYISRDIQVGSLLRRYSELKIGELFAQKAWARYGHAFSSCNIANYTQGRDNTTLGWCGECPKCANSFLLFAPFVPADDLKSLFGGQDLFEKPLLTETFKGLLAIEGIPKPFECVGETDELRYAYHKRGEGYGDLPFVVPQAVYDYEHEYPVQDWAQKLIK